MQESVRVTIGIFPIPIRKYARLNKYFTEIMEQIQDGFCKSGSKQVQTLQDRESPLGTPRWGTVLVCQGQPDRVGWCLPEESFAEHSVLQDSCSSIGRYSSDSKCGNENINTPIENIISEPPITFALHFRLKYSFTRYKG